MSTVTMDSDTDYVHTHVVNYEPTYLVLEAAAEVWAHPDPNVTLAELRDDLRDAVEQSWPEMGLRYADLDDVDYAAMIEWEVENAD
jgi:hypothetical protein